MKYLLLTLLLSISLFACKKTENNADDGLLSTWKLVEVRADNGIGTFQPVTSNKTIKFFDNNTILCEGNLCDLSLGTNPSTIGNYSNIDSTISSSVCNSDIKFSITGNTMILSYQCIEVCQAKYVK